MYVQDGGSLFIIGSYLGFTTRSNRKKKRRFSCRECHLCDLPVSHFVEPCIRMVAHLTFDACKAACASFRVTKYSAVTATVFSGQPDGSQLMFLFHINLLHPWCPQQGSPFLCWQRLQKEIFIYFCVIQVNVIIWNIIQCENVGFIRLYCAILCNLKSEMDRPVKKLCCILLYLT